MKRMQKLYGVTIMPAKSMTKYNMLMLAYAAIDYIYRNNSREELVWQDYHDFPIAEIPKDWYKNTKKLLGIKSKEYTLQLGKCKEEYKGKDHYHKIGHQLVIILGPRTGFMEPKGVVRIDGVEYPVVEDQHYYFPTGVEHGFTGSFYFINLQNPPLINEQGEDDYNTYD